MAERESIYLWSTTASGNGSIDPNINFAEGQLPGTLNNSNRSDMAAHARHLKDNNGSISTGGSANAYTLTINGTQTAYANGHELSFKASFSNTGASTLNVTNADATALGAKAIRVVDSTGEVALSANMIRSGGHYKVQYDTAANSSAGAFILLNPSPQTQRTVLTSGLTLYVDNALGNDSNAGTASGASAKKTLQSAWDSAVNNYDFRGLSLDINVADATYGAGIVTAQAPLGCSTVRINGNTTTPANCFISATSDSSFRFQNIFGVPVQIKGFKLKTTAGICLDVGFGSTVYLTDKMEFNTSTGAQIQVSNAANVVAFSNYTINGSSGSDHHHVINGATLGVDGITITLSSTPNFPGAFLGAAGVSFASYTSTVFSGSGTGTRYNIHGQSYIKTAAASPSTFFPGNVAGTSDGGNLDDDTMGGAWVSWTSTPTPATGSFTATLNGAYKLIGGSGGKGVMLRGLINISNANTGAGAVSVAIPTGTANGYSSFVAREVSVSGATGSGYVANGSTSLTGILKSDGSTTLIATGANIILMGHYEIS